jgi:hypothetical protein
MKFYEAWFCDGEEMCHSGQYFALRKSKEIAWFANKPGFNPEDGLCDDAKKLICESCYKDPNGDSLFLQGYFAKVWDLGFLPKFSPKML